MDAAVKTFVLAAKGPGAMILDDAELVVAASTIFGYPIKSSEIASNAGLVDVLLIVTVAMASVAIHRTSTGRIVNSKI